MNSAKTILIFDDDEDILELCNIILKQKGYDVHVSNHVRNIIEKIEEVQPAVIFIDNWIPDVGGITATRLVKADERLKHIPVIYFSANNNIKALAEEAGANDHLAKPFNIADLENIIEKHL